MASTIVEELAALAHKIRGRGLTDAELHAATRATLDWFGATLAGSVMAPGTILTETLVAAEPGPIRLVGLRETTSMRTAALINATASHTAEMDDIYRDGIYHPGSPTVAAALALGEQLGVSGAVLLRAIAVGYEIGDRVAATVNPRHYEFWHTTGTVGTIGAAAAAADLLDLDASEFAHALATATTMAAGLQQAFRSDAMSKPLHAGHAAEAGLLAALAAARGFTGALDVLEGAAGFGVAMAASPQWAMAMADPDGELRIAEATVKNHSCCGHTFAAVDAALALRGEGLSVSDIDSIEVRTYITATRVAGNPDPRTDFEAKFSTAYCVAAALQLGSVRLRAFTPGSLSDPSLRSLAGRVTLIGDDALEADFPGRRRAVLTVRTRDGRELVARRDTRKGDPDDPLTDEELTAKFIDLAEPVLGDTAAQVLSKALWALADCDSIRKLPVDSGAKVPA